MFFFFQGLHSLQGGSSLKKSLSFRDAIMGGISSPIMHDNPTIGLNSNIIDEIYSQNGGF